MRRPVTGKVRLNILEARELAHAPTRTFKAPETLVVVKIDGNVCFRSRPSRSDHWNDQCETHVDKASEVEVTIYDQSGERSVPIGVLWLKISDIAEGLRRQKIMQDNGPGWVSAEVAQQQQYPQLPSAGSQYYGQNQMPALKPDIASGDMPSTPSASQEGIEAWFDVEPVGHIRLQLNFGKKNAYSSIAQPRHFFLNLLLFIQFEKTQLVVLSINSVVLALFVNVKKKFTK
jgi:classical protein kinase C